MMDGLVASARDASLNLPHFRYHSIVAPWLRAVEPARRVGAVAGAGGECEARELQTRVLAGEEAAPHTRSCATSTEWSRGARRHGAAPALGGARCGDDEAE